MKVSTRTLTGFLAMALVAGAVSLSAQPAQAQNGGEIKIGFVMFLSGGAAGPFGVPARNAAELVVQTLNAGGLPAPYDSPGIAGATIVPVFVDEASKESVVDYRNLVQKQEVDLVIGYISSGNCKAIAPVAEELQRLTVFFDCGTPQIFEEIVTEPRYLFRTGAHATMDSVAAARYLLEQQPDVASVAGINQNYAWGQDSWRDFSAAMKQLKPGVTVTTEQFPKIFAGQYGAEISALLTNPADAIHSSFWGGDMEAFVFQAAGRGLFQRSSVILTTGETAMHRLGQQLPDGTIIGGRGPHGNFAPASPLNDWLRQAYYDRFNTWPTYPSYKMTQAILGVKAAYEKAAGGAGGLPNQDQVIEALENLEFEGPSGMVYMSLSNGHQAAQATAYGRYKYDPQSGDGTLTDVVTYEAGCVNPPAGVNSLEWIEGGFQGAEC